MIQIRKSEERAAFDFGWLQTKHTFSFGEYIDPMHMGFRSLRVINEDVVQPGQGFGMHGHRDMEIVTLVLSGALEHRDSLGNGEVLRPGELQRMSAGTGIRHSEFNPSSSEPVHLYQIWIHPERRGLEPSYEQKAFAESERVGRWQIVASPDGRDRSLLVHQNAIISLARIEAGCQLDVPPCPSSGVWLQVLTGQLRMADRDLSAGDGAALENELACSLHSMEGADVLLFELS